MNSVSLDALTPVLLILLHASWQAGVMAVIVLAITRCLRARLSANWRFALWLVVFARLATPWIPSSPWSLYAFLPQVALQSDATNPAVPDQRGSDRKFARQRRPSVRGAYSRK
jgi:beta-lactamase regulating signal transducer with metallopeptidase domain